MMTVPVRSFRTTRATMSGVTSTPSTRVATATASAFVVPSSSTATVPASSGRAADRPSAALIAALARLAVVKSGRCSATMRTPRSPSATGTSRSTSAPSEMIATVGWLFVAEPGRPGGESAAERYRPLRHRIYLPVGPDERRQEERAALKALRVAERRDLHVDPAPLPRERRQRRRHAHRRDVLDLQLPRVDVQREPLPAEHVEDALHREDRLLAVARPVQAGDDPVAPQLVRPHALDRRDVLDARRGRRRGEALSSSTSPEAPEAEGGRRRKAPSRPTGSGGIGSAQGAQRPSTGRAPSFIRTAISSRTTGARAARSACRRRRPSRSSRCARPRAATRARRCRARCPPGAPCH